MPSGGPAVPTHQNYRQKDQPWEPTTEKQEEELLWQPYQTPKFWAYYKNYTSDWLEELQDETMVEYMFRGHAMKRAPKREYYVPGQEPPVYKWGQQKIHYPGGSDYTGLPMPDWMIIAAAAQPRIAFFSSSPATSLGIFYFLAPKKLASERLCCSRPAAAPRFRL